LVADRPIVLLDEPTVGVDIEHRRQLLGVVRELASSGKTVIYTTHYLAELDALEPESVVVMEQGGIRFDGSVGGLVAAVAGSRIILCFAVPHAVPATFPFETTSYGDRWEIAADRRDALAIALTALGDLTADLRNVELRSGGIEDAFLQLVGDHGARSAQKREVEHVGAA
jgi:ABC-2 type transport system ATP-binding protein